MLTKYTKNNLCIKLILLYSNYIEMHVQKYMKSILEFLTI